MFNESRSCTEGAEKVDQINKFDSKISISVFGTL